MQLRPQPQADEQASNDIEFRSILVVDDDRQLADAIQWILADQCFLVDVAHDGEEALQKIKANEFDTIICDVMMPKLRGDELFRRAIEARPSLGDRFIFITGFAADTQLKLFLSKTGAKCLHKPFLIKTLVDCVNQLLG